MKNILVSSILIFLQLIGFGQDSSFTVSGSIKGLICNKMYVNIYNTSSTVTRDSVIVENESFSYKGFIQQPTYVTFYPKIDVILKSVTKGYISTKSGLLQCFVEPKANVVFNGAITTYVEAYPTGTITNDNFSILCKKLNPLQNELANLNVAFIKNNEAKNKVDKKAMKNTAKLYKLIHSEKEDFLKRNPSNFESIWLLSDMLIRREMSEKEVEKYLNKADFTLFAINNYFNEIKTKLEGSKQTKTGLLMPNIVSLNTYDGKKFELTNLKGKYVIIDFWGTWCGPCVNGMPNMAKYAQKYIDKLQIVSIAKESDDGTKWKDFIAKNTDYNWVHILDEKKAGYVQQFNISAFPTKYVLSPQGNIIAKVEGEGKAFYRRLDKLLK